MEFHGVELPGVEFPRCRVPRCRVFILTWKADKAHVILISSKLFLLSSLGGPKKDCLFTKFHFLQ